MKISLFFKNTKLSRIMAVIIFPAIFQMAIIAQTPCGKTDFDCQISQAAKTIQANPNSVDGYTRRGDAYYNKGDYESSIKDYSKVLDLDPKNAQIFGYRADAYNKLKNYDLAISDYSKSIVLVPNDAVTYINRGNSYDNNGNFALAMRDYTKAIELDPDNDSAYYNRGIALYFQKKYSQAIPDFQKALQINPKFGAAENYLEKAQTASQGAKDSSGQNNTDTTTRQTETSGKASTQPQPSGGLVGTGWGLISLTKKGEQVKEQQNPPDVDFCKDGSWTMLHYGNVLQGGKYNFSGTHLVMKDSDGSAYADGQISFAGEIMTLDTGDYIYKMKYIGKVSC